MSVAFSYSSSVVKSLNYSGTKEIIKKQDKADKQK